MYIKVKHTEQKEIIQNVVYPIEYVSETFVFMFLGLLFVGSHTFLKPLSRHQQIRLKLLKNKQLLTFLASLLAPQRWQRQKCPR